MKFVVNTAIDNIDRQQRMAENLALDVPRLEPQKERPGVVAICGYGPSLQETWAEISTPFVCTTSGAHDFLLDRDIHPRWHVEFDPRAHKLAFLQRTREWTEYCLASTCHPDMFKLVKGKRVLLWHALGPDLAQDATTVHRKDADGILLLGGSNAGIRAIYVMHCLGFRRFDLHALDCSYKADGTIWAGPHTGVPHSTFRVDCNGKTYLTSDIMINSCEEIFKAIYRELKGCQFRIFGESLLAERVKLFQVDQKAALGEWWRPVDPTLVKRLPTGTRQIKELFTTQYQEQNRLMHIWNQDYGNFGDKHAPAIKDLVAILGTQDVLDYGCGKQQLAKALPFPIRNYDPAIPEVSASPDPADIVVCTDVLEHIEPECFDALLKDLARVTKRRLYVAVATGAASKTLPDGRNAHLMIRSAEWWDQQLVQHFTPLKMEKLEGLMLGLYAAKGAA